MDSTHANGSHFVRTQAEGPAPVPMRASRPLHRLAAVRRQQGVSVRRVARRMSIDQDEVRRQERETTDLPLSTLYRWQELLDVPVSELLVDSEATLSPPILERARLVKLMKTATAIAEQAERPAIRRMAQTLINQLVEIMPELKGVMPWHSFGQRRTLNDFGRAAERRLPLPAWAELELRFDS